MTAGRPPRDRRAWPRLDASPLTASLRVRGGLIHRRVVALDFNRYGIALRCAQPLERDRRVYLTLCCAEVQVQNVVGVVHNCLALGGAFRCGIRFRPGSALQLDRLRVEDQLARLEQALAEELAGSVRA